MLLREMQKADLSQVNLILSKAFTHAALDEGLQSKRVPLCKPDFLEMYLAANPSGSFVLEDSGKVVAYAFSRLWGKVGWIGPLSVIPSEGSKGLGTQITGACIEQLKMRGATTIGLEMPARSCRNLGFYTKLGFVPGQLTVDMMRRVAEKRSGSRLAGYESLFYSKLTDRQKHTFKERMLELSGALESGLDYASEVDLVRNFGFGDACLISRNQRTLGFVLAHTESYSSEEQRQFLKVNALQLHFGWSVDLLNDVLGVLEGWANREGLRHLYIRIPTRYYRAFRHFVSMNFTIVSIDLRMTLLGYEQTDSPEAINLSKWE